jgi:hypothetical protein
MKMKEVIVLSILLAALAVPASAAFIRSSGEARTEPVATLPDPSPSLLSLEPETAEIPTGLADPWGQGTAFGSTDVNSNFGLGDGSGNTLSGPFTTTVVNDLSVPLVPEPGTLLLIGSGLVGLLFLKGRGE